MQKFINLEVLCLRGNPISETGSMAIAECLKTSNIKYLDLADCELGFKQFEQICFNLKSNKKLEVLNLLQNKVDKRSLQIFTSFFQRNLTSPLTVLKLGTIDQMPDMLKSFVSSCSTCKSLRFVYITSIDHSHPSIQDINQDFTPIVVHGHS